MSIELATAYVTIATSTKGVGASINRDLTKAGDEGGKRAGSRFASRFKRGSDTAAAQTESRFAKTAKKVATLLAGAFVVKKGISFLTGAADGFKGAVGEAAKLRRFLGGSIEDASRLRFVAQQVGIDSDKFARGLGLFNKNLAGGKLDDLIGKTRDANGQLLPMSQLLPRIAERFAGMDEGPEKTALAMKLFGRAGADLIPLLNKGSDGIAELTAKADELGLTLTDKDVDAMKQANANSRLWKSSLEAVRIQIGRYVLPVLSKFTGFLATHMPRVAGVVRQVFGILFQRDFTGGPLAEDSPIVDNLFKFRDLVAEIVPKVQAGFGRIVEAVSPLVGAVRRFFANDPRARFAAIAAVLGGVFLGAVVAIGTAVAGLFAPIYLVVGAIAVWAFGLIYAYKRFDGFRKVVDSVARWLVSKAWPAVQRFGLNTIDMFKRVAAWTKAHWTQIKAPVVATVSWFTGTAWPALRDFGALVAEKWADLVAYTRRTWPAIREAVANVVHGISSVVGAVVRFVADVWSRWGDNLGRVAKTVWSFITSTVSNALQLIRGIIKTVTSLFRGDWSGAWEGIKQIAGALLKQIGNIVARGLGLIRQLLGMAVDLLGAIWTRLWSGIKTVTAAAVRWVGDRFTDMVGFVTSMPRRMASTVVNLWKGIIDGAQVMATWVSDRIDDVVGFVVGLPDRVSEVVSGAFDGIKEAFRSALNWVIDRWNEFKFPKQHVPGTDIDIGGFGLPHIDRIPAFHTGGVVPGRRGQEVIIRALAGETVVPIAAASRPAAAPAADAGAAGRWGPTYNGPVSFGISAEEVHRRQRMHEVRQVREAAVS